MNVLLICPIFFDYEKAIARELGRHAQRVIYRNEIPFNSAFKYHALRRLSKRVAQMALERYNRELAQLVERKKIDTVLIVRGSGLLPSFFEAIGRIIPAVRIINYQWDSLRNNPNGLTIARFSDTNFSFDLADCHVNPQFKHLPLFYTWDTINDTGPNSEPECDIFFVGTYHSSRHLVVKELERQCRQQGFNLRSHIYIPRGIYWRRKFSSGEQIERCDVSFHKLSRERYHRSLLHTKAVLDIQSQTQTGATIRTIETLSVGRKLISTNTMLQDEQFYSPDNIYLWDTEQLLPLNDILHTPFNTSRQDTLLGLRDWVERVLA